MNTQLRMDYVSLLSRGFNSHVGVREKRPGITKLLVPLFHDDGDMIDLFVEDLADGRVRVSDFGLSVMRLSYSFDIDTSNKERIFRRILNEAHVSEDNGRIYIDVAPTSLYPAVLHLAQTIAKVGNMALYRREVIANLFYEMLDQQVRERFSKFGPRTDLRPIPDREELVVDYGFEQTARPVYLWGVKEKDTAKLRLVAVSCLEFQRKGLPFRSVVVHQDFSSLSKTDQKIITNAVDKQFTGLSDFEAGGEDAISRLAA